MDLSFWFEVLAVLLVILFTAWVHSRTNLLYRAWRRPRRWPIAKRPRKLQFTVFWQRDVAPHIWSDLLVYLHTESASHDVDEDQRRRAKDHDHSTSASSVEVARGADITVVPEVDGLEFNPPSASIRWLEDWHCVPFRFRFTTKEHTTRHGFVRFYAGPILIGEVPLIMDRAVTSAPFIQASTRPFRKIFVSYAHDDSEIVDRLQSAYRAIGDTYLRDVELLRSGQRWMPAILRFIAKADIFQLCWSEAAKRSKYVEKEWRRARKLRRADFIRPMYWKKPLPEPPAELADLHFTFVSMD